MAQEKSHCQLSEYIHHVYKDRVFFIHLKLYRSKINIHTHALIRAAMCMRCMNVNVVIKIVLYLRQSLQGKTLWEAIVKQSVCCMSFLNGYQIHHYLGLN